MLYVLKGSLKLRPLPTFTCHKQVAPEIFDSPKRRRRQGVARQSMRDVVAAADLLGHRLGAAAATRSG
jgi:hypothetical protein